MSVMSTRITQGGRVVIPAEFRRALGLEEGDEVILRLVDSELRITGLGGNQESAVEVIPFDAEMAYTAACLRPQTRRFGLSLGDRCCLALGIVRQSTVVTTEHAWSKLKQASASTSSDELASPAGALAFRSVFVS
jgi:AbrB family looped-hinge helix DNA binding protein